MGEVPAIPDAMVEAAQIAIAALWLEKDPKDPSDIELATVATLSAFAAAPPEWLLRALGHHFEWTDEEGTRAVIYRDRLSLYDKPSMTADDGDVAIGIDLPRALRGGEEPMTSDEELDAFHERWGHLRGGEAPDA